MLAVVFLSDLFPIYVGVPILMLLINQIYVYDSLVSELLARRFFVVFSLLAKLNEEDITTTKND